MKVLESLTAAFVQKVSVDTAPVCCSRMLFQGIFWITLILKSRRSQAISYRYKSLFKKRDEPNQRLTNFESENYHRLFHVNQYVLPLLWVIMHLSCIPFLLPLFWPSLSPFRCNIIRTAQSLLHLLWLLCELRSWRVKIDYFLDSWWSNLDSLIDWFIFTRNAPVFIPFHCSFWMPKSVCWQPGNKDGYLFLEGVCMGTM